MDRSVDPCTDFFRYSCGAWLKKNPIPPDQASWDVYSKLSQDNQLFLWGILDQASKPSAGRSLVETEIGDYFNACMDESAVEKAGAAPLKPGLDEIAALRSLRDLPAYLGREHLNIAGSHMLFGFGSNQDFADSSRIIAFASAGGLGLPDRDYYVKTDAKSQETRQKYVEHMQRMFELLGDAPRERVAARGGGPVVPEHAAEEDGEGGDERRHPHQCETSPHRPSRSWGRSCPWCCRTR